MSVLWYYRLGANYPRTGLRRVYVPKNKSRFEPALFSSASTNTYNEVMAGGIYGDGSAINTEIHNLSVSISGVVASGTAGNAASYNPPVSSGVVVSGTAENTEIHNISIVSSGVDAIDLGSAACLICIIKAKSG
jgi:hypothetical protein